MANRVKAGTSVSITTDGGEVFTYSDGEVVPDEHAELVGNPGVWDNDDDGDDDELIAAANANSVSEGDPNLYEVEGNEEFEGMTVPELRQYAEDNDIGLGDATRKADIIAVLSAAEAEG